MAKEPSQWISFLIRNSSNSGALFAPIIFRTPLTSHRTSEYTDQRSCVSPEIVTLLYAHCFFDRASSKANSPSSLRPPKTKASTQNLQTHPPLSRAFLVRHSSLNYREFKTENWWVHSSRHLYSSHLKPIHTSSVICTRTLSNLFAKRIVIPFCKRELHA